ncbi:MAG: Hsp70 family protein [Pseudomonadota bacterium]
MKYNLGIDLGTTFSAVAVVDESGRPKILSTPLGKTLVPSVIYFGGDEILIGDEAKEMQALGEANIASFFKRNMGDPNFILNFADRDYTPLDLSAIMLRHLKTEAEAALGAVVEQAVITVPAYFNNFQREATIKAGEMAGLNVLRIINEPTAAALAYGLRSKNKTVLVYDLGGGTFDVTLVHIKPSNITVLATDGDHELGGKDWDDRIATYLGQRFLEDHKIDPLENIIAFNDLLVRCENAKKQLSQRSQARISFSHEGERETYILTRAQFEEITKDLMERTQLLTKQVLEEAGLNWKQLDGVLLVGGATRMPMVWQYVEKMSGKKPMTGVNVDEAVALGAAIQANLDGVSFTLPSAIKIQDVMSHSLGMVAENEDRSRYINSIIIPKNKPIPCVESRHYQLRTAHNQENKLKVYMLQGESDEPTQCVILGQYTFSEVIHVEGKPAIIDIEYAYDKNGVVTVSATQRETGKNLPQQTQQADELSWLSLPPQTEVVAVHISIFMVIDVSSSMRGAPLKEAKQAAKEFVKKSDLAHTSIGLIEFGCDAKMISAPTQNAKAINRAINKLNIHGSTNMTDGLKTAHAELKHGNEPRFIVLLTDGYPNNSSSAMQTARQICADGIELITIGTGGADKDFLKKLACSDENSIFAQAGTVVSTFSSIAQVLTESGGNIRQGNSFISKM